MKIDSNRSIRQGAPVKGRGNAAGSGSFARELGRASDAPETAATASAGSVGAIMALAAFEDPIAGRRRAIERGNKLLDILEEIRTALLTGSLSRDAIARLGAWIEEKRPLGDQDPELAELLAEIELRAAVELAKIDAAG